MKVLVAEDEPTTAHKLIGLLAKLGHTTVHVETGRAALAVLEAPGAPPLAILDWIMPEVSGLEVCRRIRTQVSGAGPYILMLTARTSSDDVVAGLEAGANDYLRKPFDWRELRARIAVAERAIAVQDELLARAANDDLTGLLNRRGILERLQYHLRVMARTKLPVSVMVLDIDHFKAINDAAGHAAGDEVLRAVADCMKLHVRCYDEVGRYGGEEFLVVLPDCDAAGAAVVAERVRAAVERLGVPLADGRTTCVTVSAGVMTALEAHDCNAERLIEVADSALYAAKNAGRNRVAVGAADTARAA